MEKFIADFHIHSHYSRATSKEMNISELSKWAQLKGINVMGTGDFTHPKWFKEMREKLELADGGLYKLKSKHEKEIQKQVPKNCQTNMRFIPTVEISSIYKKNDRVRKMHNIVIANSFESVSKINKALSKIGNVMSDGRPILGLDSKELLKIVLNVSDANMLIPAHIWTPWFALFGSQSGFESIEECFDELKSEIYAVETGLSSDPIMNWQIPELDNRALVSNSDAHSARKLGREANVFNTELSYKAITKALKTNDKKAFESTIEFYPEEGKYHLDGHRECGVRMMPSQTKSANGMCKKCGKQVTVGVLSQINKMSKRVIKKSVRKYGFKPKNARPFKNIIPLPEIIAQLYQCGVRTKKVDAIYMQMLNQLGNEFKILIDTPLSEIKDVVGSLLAEAINRVRCGKIRIEGGYDGEFGTIEIFNKEERKKFEDGKQPRFDFE